MSIEEEKQMTMDELLAHSKKKYIAKLGNTFLVSPISENAVESISDNELDKLFSDFRDEMLRCLKNEPNITKCSSEMDSELMGSFYIQEIEDAKGKEQKIQVFNKTGIAPNYFDYIEFQAVWPKKNQDVLPWYSGTVIETFHIIYDGAIFIAFGETNSIGEGAYTWQFGLEAMKIIELCFNKSELWEITKIGPIMFHPDIYFVFIDKDVVSTLPTTFISNNDLYVFFPYKDASSCEMDIEDFFSTVSYPLKEQIGSLILRKECMYTEMEFNRKFEALASVHKKLLNLNSWNPVNLGKRFNYVNQLRNGIREAYEIYVELMDMQASLTQERSRTQTTLLKNKFLKELAEYFDEQISDVGKTDFSPILQGFRFLEEETRMVTTIRSNLQSALIGALVASAIYAIASTFTS